MNSSNQQLISIVVPVYNERENIDSFFARVVPILESLNPEFDYEIVVTDNCSTDGTFDRLLEIAERNRRVTVFRFSRNFGYQKSILTGLLKAHGAAAIQLDCDLQDPPELIPEFLRLWKDGNQVVYGIRKKRQEGFLITGIRKLFYCLINAISNEELPADAGDFRLMDRKILEELRKFNDDRPYIRGTIASLGFRQIGIPYERAERTNGESKFSVLELFALAGDGILNHSLVPLRLATYTGLLLSFTSLTLMLGYIVAKLVFQLEWPGGFTTLIVAILFSFGMLSVFLGIIGEYVGRIHQQLKDRPITIIEQSVNARGSRFESHKRTQQTLCESESDRLSADVDSQQEAA